MTAEAYRSGRSCLGWVACIAALGLAACAPVQTTDKKAKAPPQVVFPAPPDEPRFIYERTIHGTADVVAAESDSKLKQLLTGVTESGEGMIKPYAVAVHRGRIFVSDSVGRLVRVYDVPQGRAFDIGNEDPGALLKPLGIDVDEAGNLYVADATAKAILIYDRDGKFLRKIGTPLSFHRLASVTVDRAGDRIYVVDLGGIGTDEHRVRVYDARTGTHLFDLGKRGTGPGEFNMPRDVAIGKNGELYVVDGGNFRIQVFDASGKYVKSFGQVGTGLGNFARPKEVSIDAEGNLYVIDAAFGNFQIFNPEGELLLFVGDRAEKDGPARFMLPSGIFVDEDGRIYVVDQWFKKVDVFRPAALPAKDGFLGARPPEK